MHLKRNTLLAVVIGCVKVSNLLAHPRLITSPVRLFLIQSSYNLGQFICISETYTMIYYTKVYKNFILAQPFDCAMNHEKNTDVKKTAISFKVSHLLIPPTTDIAFMLL